ncbi:C-C motif chemokine 20a.3 [Thalassophryne amazonica]|uniref:C-C motif chemokine 20a.3 n=1 Tax=Thalassophryne amazonica TaxID=390379 RepID=UPI001471CB9A|nr:C-C motif chemokine 20a.3 [Thalassophryne amazonica]
MVQIKGLILLLTICLSDVCTSAAYHSHGCCRQYTRGKIPLNNIKGYSVQTVKEMCPINAIIFHTKRGKVCTNPAFDWVMDYVNHLRKKAEIVHIKTSQA